MSLGVAERSKIPGQELTELLRNDSVPRSKVLYLDFEQDSLYATKNFACPFAPEVSRIVSGSDEMPFVLTLKNSYRKVRPLGNPFDREIGLVRTPASS